MSNCNEINNENKKYYLYTKDESIDDDYDTLDDYAQVTNDVGDTTIAYNEGSAIVDVNVRFEQRQ